MAPKTSRRAQRHRDTRRTEARIPARNLIVVKQIRFDRSDPVENECANYLRAAGERQMAGRMKELLLLGFAEHLRKRTNPTDRSFQHNEE